MGIKKELTELLEAKVIEQTTADRITAYYKNKKSPNKISVVFGVIGAILVGLGIILILGHNWDELSRTIKSLIAFSLLLVGQILCGFTLLKKSESMVWKESSSVFLFFVVGASISLISQIYNIPGNVSEFIIVWLLLCLPLVYIMPSSIVSLLYIIGITYYGCDVFYWGSGSNERYLHWILLSLILPHYYLLCTKKPNSNIVTFHNWLIPISILILLWTIYDETEMFMFFVYGSLLAVLYSIGNLDFFKDKKVINNGFKVLGSIGTLIVLIVLSFEEIWRVFERKESKGVEVEGIVEVFNQIVKFPEFVAFLFFTLLALTLLYINKKGKSVLKIEPAEVMFLVVIAMFILGLNSLVTTVIINCIIFIMGVFKLIEGARENKLIVLNYGLFIITGLIVCRFFDYDLGFAFRGVLFIVIGIVFFGANYLMLKRRKENEA